MPLIHFLIPVLHVCLAVQAENGYLKIYDKKTWRVALDQCMAQGDGFTFPLTGTSNQEGIQGLATWLPIRRIRYPTWTGLDNKRVGSWFEEQNWGETMNCGIIHLRDGMLEAEECNRVMMGILCESIDEQSCNEKQKDRCFTIRGRSFYYECGTNNWYGAKFRCRQLKMDLAVVKSKDMARALKALYRPLKRTCIRVWVGLRREDWLYEAHRVISDFWMPWAQGEPASDGNCAVSVGNPDSGSLWKAVVCGANYHWLCIQNKAFKKKSTFTELGVHGGTTKIYSLKDDITIDQTDSKTHEERAGNRSEIVAGVVVPIILLATIGFVLFMIIRMRKQKEIQNKKYKCTDEEERCLKLQAPEILANETLDVTVNETLNNSKEIASEEESTIENVDGKLETQINTTEGECATESFAEEVMNFPQSNLTITKTITHEGGTLNSDILDTSFTVSSTSIPEGEEGHEIATEEESTIENVDGKLETQINTTKVECATESFAKEAMNFPQPDLTITKTITNEGGTLSSDLSDIRFIVSGTSILGGEEGQVSVRVYSDMKSERYNIQADEFLVCPVVELIGNKDDVQGTLRLEHVVQNRSAIKVLRSEALPNGKFSWFSVKNMVYKINEKEIEITVKGILSAYTCTLQKNIGGNDYESLSQAIFVDYKKEYEFQELTVCLYLIKTCHNLTDYLKHIHGNIEGVQRVIEFEENFTCSSLKSTGIFHIDLEWPDSSWQEDGQCRLDTENLLTSRKKYVIDRDIDFLNQPLGYKIAEYHLRQDMSGPLETKFRLGFNIDAVYVNDRDTQSVFYFLEEFAF